MEKINKELLAKYIAERGILVYLQQQAKKYPELSMEEVLVILVEQIEKSIVDIEVTDFAGDEIKAGDDDGDDDWADPELMDDTEEQLELND